MRDLRVVRSPWDQLSPGLGQRLSDQLGDPPEHGRPAITERDQRRAGESRQALEVDPQSVWIPPLFEVGGSVGEQRFASSRLESGPASGRGGDPVEIEPRAPLAVPRIEKLGDRCQDGPQFRQLRPLPIVEEVEQRGFMNGQGAYELRPRRRKAKSDRASPGGSGDVGGLQAQRLDQAGHIVDILVNRAGRSRHAAAVASAVEGDDLERPRERRANGIPHSSVDPRSMDEQQRLSSAAALVVEPGFVDGREGHPAILALPKHVHFEQANRA